MSGTRGDLSELKDRYRLGLVSRREFIRRAGALGIAATGIGALLVSCAPSTPTAASPLPSGPRAPTGTLRLGLASLDQILDPHLGSSDVLRGALGPMFDTIVREVPAEQKPMGVAESYELAPDNTTWTFKLRKGVKFHNGTELTAKDVKFSLERFAGKDARLPYIRDFMKTVEAVDDFTIRVTTNGVQPFFKTRIGWGGTTVLMLSKDYYEKVGAAEAVKNPIGTGPFKFVKEVKGDMTEYEALTDHFRRVSAFKTLQLLQVPDAGTRVAMLKTGELEVTTIPFDAAADVEAAGRRTFVLNEVNLSVMFNGVYDPRAKGMPVADSRVRQALSLAINRDELGKTFLAGRVRPIMPPATGPDQANDIDVAYWRQQATKTYRYDPTEAMQLLRAAGFGNGFTVKMYSYATPDAAYLPRLAEVIQGYWSKIGVRAEITPIDLAVFRPMVTTSSTQRTPPNPAAIGAVNLNSAPPTTMPVGLVVYFGGGAWSLLQDGAPEVLQAVQAANSEVRDKVRYELNAKAIQAVMDSHTMEMIAAVPSLAGLAPTVDIDPTRLAGNRVDTIVQFADLAQHRS